MDAGVTNLQCPLNLQSLQYKDTKKNKGGRCRYKLKVRLKFPESTIQMTKNIKGGRWEFCKVYHAMMNKMKGGRWRCKLAAVCLKFADSTVQRYQKKQGWTLELQTYSVLEICRVCHTKTQKHQGWTLALQTGSMLNICRVYRTNIQESQGLKLALQTFSVLEICKVYRTKIQKVKGGHWRYKLTVCRWNLQSLPCKD